MASIKQTPSGAFQLCVKNKLLPKTLWATFDTRDAAEQYGAQLERLLRQGIVPSSLLAQEPPKPQSWTIGRCIAEYERHNAVPESDVKLLDTILPGLALLGTSTLNYDWAEAWIRSMKRVDHLAPSTIRHRHGALARCFDWVMRNLADQRLQRLTGVRVFRIFDVQLDVELTGTGTIPEFIVHRARLALDRDQGVDRIGLQTDRAPGRALDFERADGSFHFGRHVADLYEGKSAWPAIMSVQVVARKVRAKRPGRGAGALQHQSVSLHSRSSAAQLCDPARKTLSLAACTGFSERTAGPARRSGA